MTQEQHAGRRRGITLAVAAIAASVLMAACTPVPPTSTTTTTIASPTPVPPVVNSFTTLGSIGTSPALVGFAWSVGDANNEPLTCSIDGTGDGIVDVTIPDCHVGGGSRNISVALPPGATTAQLVTATLTVEDGNSAPVIATRQFTLAPGPTEPFDITLRGLAALTPDEALAFTQAVTLWQQIIVAGLPDVASVPTSCLPPGTAPIVGAVDDIVIDLTIAPIDGPGNVLGSAGPDCVNTATELALHGTMTFDSADVAAMLTDGSFTRVVLHEMAHVLGFGTLWDETLFGGVRKIVQGVGGSNPRYSGVRGMAEWSLLGGSGNVPVENSGGTGTAGSHWRESVFDDELMTGYLDLASNPLSRLTIASFADLGYHVDITKAEAYTLPTVGSSSSRSSALRNDTVDGIMLRPPVGRL